MIKKDNRKTANSPLGKRRKIRKREVQELSLPLHLGGAFNGEGNGEDVIKGTL